jgi:5-methyltetrahydropteroyltriglutamate--homocysteine methyltransferase
MLQDVKTSVIGSYPVDINRIEFIKGYFNGIEISWNKYISNAVNDMVNAGIDIVSDGQTRDPFINIFTRKLIGCRIRNRTEIIDRVEYSDPITLKDQIYIRTLIQNQKKVIGVIVGPHTLCESVVDLYYKDKKELSFDFAYALKHEAKALQNHVDLISIDEPFFSNFVPEYGKELIDIITNNISCPIRLHVCGDISDIIPEIIEMPVDILSHEFKASPQLFDVLSEYDFPQKICLGSVRSDNKEIETVDEIANHIKKAISILGDSICQIAPDCGQRLLPRKIAFQKLKNLVLARKKIFDC